MSKLFEKIIIGILLFTIFLLLTLSSVSESRVYDEIVHVNSGYQFLVNQDFRYDPFNPPFARELIALPLLINKQFANDPLLFYPRLVVIIFSVLLAFLVYLFSKKLFGGLAGILALSIFIIEPNILAYGHYASTDVIFTFFYILSFYLYYIWQNNLTMKRIIIFGIVVGLMLSTKTSALPYFFLPFIFILILKIKGKKLFSLKKIKPYFFKTLIFVFFLLMSLWSTYFFTMEPMLGYRFDPNRQAIKLAKEN
ncbi:MAG: glycosyltransferase family 39 protein, partial [Candidatus Levyibacteriota bacterium]